jgi:hypothetical protein
LCKWRRTRLAGPSSPFAMCMTWQAGTGGDRPAYEDECLPGRYRTPRARAATRCSLPPGS